MLKAGYSKQPEVRLRNFSWFWSISVFLEWFLIFHSSFNGFKHHFKQYQGLPTLWVPGPLPPFKPLYIIIHYKP